MDLSVLKKNIRSLRSAGILVVIFIVVGHYMEKLQNRFCRQPILCILWSPLPDTDQQVQAQHYGFGWTAMGWRHNTMDLQEAYGYAERFYHKNPSISLLPPETSIFDQWPQFAAAKLEKREILSVFREYHHLALEMNQSSR